MEIIVREKCGLPHHINYFCSPTYNVRHLCFVMQRYEENPTSATQSPKTYTNNPKIDIDDVGLPTSTTSTHRHRRCRFRGYGRGAEEVSEKCKRWIRRKGSGKGKVTWKHKTISKEFKFRMFRCFLSKHEFHEWIRTMRIVFLSLEAVDGDEFHEPSGWFSCSSSHRRYFVW